MPAAVAWLIALLWFTFWCVFIRAAWRGIAAGRASVAWPCTRGRIVGATIAKMMQPGGKGKGSRPIFRLRLKFEYEVAGQRHTASAMRACELDGSEQWGDRDDADKLAAAHPIGSERTVYYDPAAPSRGTLQVGVDRRYYGFLVLFCCIAVLALCVPAMAYGPLSPAAETRERLLLMEPAVMDHIDLHAELGVAESVLGGYTRGKTEAGPITFVQVGTNRADYEFVVVDGKVIEVRPWRKPGQWRWFRELIRFLT